MSSTSTLDASSLISVKLSQESLHQALGLVSKAVARHGIQPVLSNILLKSNAEAKTLTVAATDLDLALAVQIPAEVIEDGEITVPAQKICDLVSKLPKLDLNFHSNDKALITVSCGRSKFELKGLTAEQFPQDFLTKCNDETAAISFPVEHLQRAAHLVSFASDKREANSILNGICLEINEKGLELAATDGSRLAYYLSDEYKTEEPKKVIIPFRTVNELSRMLGGISDESVQCYLNDSSQVLFKVGGRVLSSSLIDGSYPKYQQLIPQNHNHNAVIEKAPFLSALERVAVLANERTKVVKLYFEEIGVLTVSANTPDLGEAQDQLDISQYSGQDFSIAFNVNYMIECLRSLDCQMIELKMSEPLKPIIVNPFFEENSETEEKSKEQKFSYLYLLMPVQMRSGA